MKNFVLVPLVMAYLTLQNFAQAQTTPDAGSLLQQIERERGAQLPKRMAPDKPAEPAAMRALDGASVTVTEFRFVGNTLLTTTQLGTALGEYRNRPLDFNQLQAAAAAVANAYREAGWVVRAYLPKQDITEGVVTIQIVEAVFAGGVLEGDKPKRFDVANLLARIEASQAQGQLLNANNLDRALLLADDLPGVAVSGSLRPGDRSDSTELVFKVVDEPVSSGEISVDNAGSRSTGQQRFSESITLSSPAGLGDLFNASFIATQGSEYARFSYSMPLGLHGMRIGASVTGMNYHVITPEFVLLGSNGKSQSSGFDLSYPVLRSRLRNLYFNFNYDRKRFHNEASLSVQSDYAVEISTLGMSGNIYDSIGGGGANSASLAWSSGKLDHRSLESGEIPALGGRFFKLRYSATRQQVISETLSLYASYSGQRAQRDLDSSEKFFLGGASGVRAYPASEAGGSSGQLANLELRLRLPENFTVSGFRDWGRVSNFDSAPSYSLSGVGLALAWYSSLGANVKLTLARRSGNNPNPVVSSGRDQDGSLIFNRCWLTASIPF
jgi:hemolysin activation/secretion protein